MMGSEQFPISGRELGAFLARWSFLWQCEFMPFQRLATFARERGLASAISASVLQELWRAAWLKADYVLSPRKPGCRGFVRHDAWLHGKQFYADTRRLKHRRKGWVGTLRLRPRPIRTGVVPHFHPFRYFVLYQIDRLLRPPISRFQLLYSDKGFHRLLDDHIQRFRERTRNRDFVRQIDRWNAMVNLAVALEPFGYPGTSGSTRVPTIMEDREWAAERNTYWATVQPLLIDASMEFLESIRLELCREAESLDPNRSVHTLLRIARRGEKLRGRLGGAVLLKTMAEILRRASERAFGVELPEEDDRQFGVWMRSPLKEQLYGAHRLLDQDAKVITEYLRHYGLDYRPRVRWYVEGDTELGALQSILKDELCVDLVNLRGRVAEKKLAAFRDSLRSDIRNQVFSFVSIDGDRSDYVKVVWRAAEQDELFGEFHIHTPDFEFANFTRDEMEEVIWAMAVDNGALPEQRAVLGAAITDVQNVNVLHRKAREALPEALPRLKKDKAWGERLMRYAIQHPAKGGAGSKRQVLEAVEKALRTRIYTYEDNRRDLRVSSEGRLVSRDST